jgi:phenylpropionate dioxygenase-like ring-hydroxylating dioxygenase large terminal subunit
MNAVSDPKATPGAVRPDYVPKDNYLSREFLARERDRLWPRVWQVACREEELPKVGSFLTYDIMDESIVLVRTSATEIRAFFNVCQHRGRRLADGCGQISQFHCRFHGWQYDLTGKVTRILDREDWAGCPDFKDQDLSLVPLKVDTWGGFVFVNMDPDCEPLRAFLDPVPQHLDPFELEKMRYRWYVSVKMPCNWKVGLEAFDEGYHVWATHPQLMPTYGDDRVDAHPKGKHGMYYLANSLEHPIGSPSPRLGQPAAKDHRKALIEYFDLYDRTLRAIFSPRDVEATRRLMDLPPDASFLECIGRLGEVQREAAIASGAGWPDVTPEQMAVAGNDWHIFPNIVMLHSPDGLLCYRSLPHATDPDVCYFEVYSLLRYAPGAEPPLERMIMHGDEDWKNFKDVSIILQQDFDNMGEVQRGMKSRGFRGARTNPVQEALVSNFHRAILEYTDEG